MRDLPSGAALLALARDVLLDELLPLLPEEARVKTRLVATCMAIAAREASAGQAPVAEILAALRDFYAEKEGPRDEGEDLLRRLALDLRKGAFETAQSRERTARAMLWRLTIAKLREGNPGFLAANGIIGS
jgi:hypothetical protein